MAANFQVRQPLAGPRRNLPLPGRHVPHGLPDSHRHLHHHPAPLHPHLHQEPRGQLGLVGAVAHLLVGLEVGSDPREGGRPRQELSTQGRDWISDQVV